MVCKIFIILLVTGTTLMQNLRKIDDDDDEIEVSQTHPCSILAYQSWENKINLYGNKCIKIGQVLLSFRDKQKPIQEKGVYYVCCFCIAMVSMI